MDVINRPNWEPGRDAVLNEGIWVIEKEESIELHGTLNH